MNQVDNIRKGQLLFVVLEGQTRVRTVEVVEIRKNCEESIDPLRYMDIVVRYIGSKTNGTVAFFPEDFGKIIFVEPYDAHQKSKENKKEQMFEKIATFFEEEKNWERMRNCWYSNGYSHDFRELLKEAMELE